MAENRQTYYRSIELDYRNRLDYVKYAERSTVDDVIKRVNIYNLPPGHFRAPETTEPWASHRLADGWQYGLLYKLFKTDKFNGVELHFFGRSKYAD